MYLLLLRYHLKFSAFMKIFKFTLATSAALFLIGSICAAALYWHPNYWKSVAGLESISDQKMWHAFLWRAQLYLQKVKGGVPELSWSELWQLTRPESEFQWREGRSLESGLHFSSYASGSAREVGARIFHDRCAACHGTDGSGSLHGPSLAKAGYKHGDSDLAIYKTLRDGIPGTGMPSAGLSLKERLEVIAAVRMLQLHSSESRKPGEPRLAIQVNDERLKAAGTTPDEWLTYSGSYNGWRHTPLAHITPANVNQLKLRWTKEFDTNDSGVPGVEATPLVIDGVIFLPPVASNVLALDARTGDILWEYRRPIPDDLPLCCGRKIRGLGVHGNTVFLASIDGYLVAINANDGKAIWETLVASPSDGYSMTGAPLVVNHSVVVGVAGGEFGIRGFLAAYDVSTGQQQWKFETIPGPGEIGHETWENDAWQRGGGSTWNTGSYDPTTDLLYWGVGNPSPDHSRDVRPGDNLFTESVIALHAGTGRLAWYYQFTPHDEHDWDSAQTPVLADISIHGVVRKVICWPNRNGIYYVLDRISGEFLTGVPFVEQSWLEGFTPAGRPILSSGAEITVGGRLTKPGFYGGTNWENPAFDPERGSIFIPANEYSTVFTKLPPNEVRRPQQGQFLASGPGAIEEVPTRVVRALDAASGQRKWEYFPPKAPFYSGLLSTGGGLVFGVSGRVLFALDADTGRELWRVLLGEETKAAPISFTVDGQQVIAVAAGHSLFVFGL